MNGSAMMTGVLAPVAEKLREWEGNQLRMLAIGPELRLAEVDYVESVIYSEDTEAHECETCGMQSDMLLMFHVGSDKVFGWEHRAKVIAVSNEAVVFELDDDRYSIAQA